MDKHFSLEDARLLLDESERNLTEITEYYRSSLINRSVDKRLSLRIKTLFDNLRSALDYCAVALVETYSLKKPKRIFFPYANKETTYEMFSKIGKSLDKAIPGLREKNNSLYSFILSVQHFSGNDFQFVPDIFLLNNKNKHFRLMPSIINDKIEVNVGGLHLRVNSLNIGDGGSIVTNGGSVNGPVSISSSTIPISGKVGDAKVSRWADIKIEGFAYPLNSAEFSEYAFSYVSHVVNSIYELTH